MMQLITEEENILSPHILLQYLYSLDEALTTSKTELMLKQAFHTVSEGVEENEGRKNTFSNQNQFDLTI